VRSIQHVFHHVVIKIRQLFLRPAACLTSTLLETGVCANDCKLRDQQLALTARPSSSSTINTYYSKFSFCMTTILTLYANFKKLNIEYEINFIVTILNQFISQLCTLHNTRHVTNTSVIIRFQWASITSWGNHCDASKLSHNDNSGSRNSWFNSSTSIEVLWSENFTTIIIIQAVWN
jgi:hypothetical protein